jgi:hypothetical protein
MVPAADVSGSVKGAKRQCRLSYRRSSTTKQLIGNWAIKEWRRCRTAQTRAEAQASPRFAGYAPWQRNGGSMADGDPAMLPRISCRRGRTIS